LKYRSFEHSANGRFASRYDLVALLIHSVLLKVGELSFGNGFSTRNDPASFSEMETVKTTDLVIRLLWSVLL